MIKYVIAERSNYSHRITAIRGLSFATREEAEAHHAKFNEYRRDRTFVESRKIPDLDKSQAMHCQCCQWQIHAASGTIAHHGYRRPGHGWQTTSCFGAKRLPWEVDRSAVKDLIDHLKMTLLRHEYACMAVSDEIEPVTHSYYGEYDSRTGHSPWLEITFTRETFEDVKQQMLGAFTRLYGNENSFESLKTKDLINRGVGIKRLKQDIKEFTARYNGWQQTHKRDGDLWVAI